jgi:hypothetical protein
MVRFVVALLIAAPFCAGPCHAQDNSMLAPLDPSIIAPVKPHPANNARKGAATRRAGKLDPEEADKAARLAEGRKKFFEQSMGFDEGKSGPVTITNDNGGPPALGLKF